LAAARGFRGAQAWAAYLLGEISARRDPPEVARAEEHYRRTLALAGELGMRPLVAHCHRGLGLLYQRVGERQKAEEQVATALAMYRDMDMGFWLEKAEVELR
jgi:sugar phosphate isomerase/epimerase